MSGDEKLIRRVLDYEARNPKIWHPTAGCRTIDGTLCLRAMAVDLSGGKWADRIDEGLSEWVLAEKADNPRDVIHVIHPHDRARRLFGVDLPPGDSLSPDDLRRLIER